jgi:SNF2 family DNA or RNA helicase
MPKSAVLRDLPPKTYIDRFIEMTPKQATAYRQMEKGLVAQINDGVVIAANPLVQLTRMSQFASAYAEVSPEGNVTLSAPSNKIDALLEEIEDMGGKPLVVMASSRQLIGLAEKALTTHKISFSLIVGGQTSEERDKAMQDFQNGRVQVVLCTIAAGGIGITLTKADTMVFLQRSWSNIENSQAEDRIHRIGAQVHDNIRIIDILSAGTLEERQRVVLAGKQERLEEVMRDRETLLRILGAA